MFGCGKFEEERILLYLEGNKDIEIENHLKECKICLKALVELNRINAEMESFKSLKKQNVIVIESIKDKINSFFSTLKNPRIVSAGIMHNENIKEIFTTEFYSFIIKISLENGLFWISISNKDEKSFKVELTKKGEDVPSFLKTDALKEITIKNLKNNEYILKINDEILELNLKHKEVL